MVNGQVRDGETHGVPDIKEATRQLDNLISYSRSKETNLDKDESKPFESLETNEIDVNGDKEPTNDVSNTLMTDNAAVSISPDVESQPVIQSTAELTTSTSLVISQNSTISSSSELTTNPSSFDSNPINAATTIEATKASSNLSVDEKAVSSDPSTSPSYNETTTKNNFTTIKSITTERNQGSSKPDPQADSYENTETAEYESTIDDTTASTQSSTDETSPPDNTTIPTEDTTAQPNQGKSPIVFSASTFNKLACMPTTS